MSESSDFSSSLSDSSWYYEPLWNLQKERPIVTSGACDPKLRRYQCKDGAVLDASGGDVIAYAKKGKATPFVSGVEFNRNMREIIESEDRIRTITFPETIKTISQKAFFKNRRLISAVTNEGLEMLGTDEYDDKGIMGSGAFTDSGLRRIWLSPTIKRIGYRAF